MEANQQKRMRPIRLVVSDRPEPLVWIGRGDDLADVTEAVERLVVDVRPDGVSAQLQLMVDLEFDFPVNRVDAVAADGSSWLDDVTSEELSRVCAGASMSESLGDALIRHLRGRAKVRP